MTTDRGNTESVGTFVAVLATFQGAYPDLNITDDEEVMVLHEAFVHGQTPEEWVRHAYLHTVEGGRENPCPICEARGEVEMDGAMGDPFLEPFIVAQTQELMKMYGLGEREATNLIEEALEYTWAEGVELEAWVRHARIHIDNPIPTPCGVCGWVAE